MMRPKLQRTETTMLLMMREVLTVKVSVTNAHADVTARPVTESQELGIHFKLVRGYSRQTTERGASKVLYHD